MNIDINKIIGAPKQFLPYEHSQPQSVPVQNNSLQRMPLLMTREGVNPEFQKFFDDTVKSILDRDTEGLYRLSDMSLPYQDFDRLIKNNWSDHLEAVLLSVSNNKGIDVEVNVERFEDIHRNLICGFNIITYHIIVKDDEFCPKDESKITELVKGSTEILFSYKESVGFYLISSIKPFTCESI